MGASNSLITYVARPAPRLPVTDQTIFLRPASAASPCKSEPAHAMAGDCALAAEHWVDQLSWLLHATVIHVTCNRGLSDSLPPPCCCKKQIGRASCRERV